MIWTAPTTTAAVAAAGLPGGLVGCRPRQGRGQEPLDVVPIRGVSVGDKVRQVRMR